MNKYKNFEDWWELEVVKMTIFLNFIMIMKIIVGNEYD